MKRLFALCIGASLLASCGGGGSSHMIPAPSATGKGSGGANGAKAKVQVSIRIAVPTASRVRKATAAKLRHVLSLASTNNSAQVQVYAQSDTTDSTALATAVVDISPTGPTCSLDGAGDRTCTFSIGAPTGADNFVFRTYDLPLVAGALQAGAQQLGAGNYPMTIVAGTSPTIPITLGGVVSAVALTLEPDTVHYIDAANGVAIVVAQDVDGNTIIGPNYVDSNGNGLGIALSPDSTGSPYLSFSYPCSPSCNSITASSANGVPFTFAQSFDPQCNVCGWTAALTGSATSTIGLTVTDTVGTAPSISGSTVLNIVYPKFTVATDPSLSVGGGFNGGGFVAGSLFYYNTPGSSSRIDTLNGTTLSELTAAPISGGLAYNAAANLIYAGGPGGFYSISTGGTPTVTPLCATGGCPASNGSAVVFNGSGTDAYYVGGSNLIDYSIANDDINTTTQLPAITNGGMALDAFGNVWIADNVPGGPVINVAPGSTTCTSLTASCAFALPAGSEPGDLASDPSDGLMWVSDRAGGHVYSVFTDGASLDTTYYLNVCGNSGCFNVQPWHLVFDPIRPKILWFDAIYNGVVAIGRIDTYNNWASIAPVGSVATGGQPGALAVDPVSDTVYMVYDGGNAVVEVQP